MHRRLESFEGCDGTARRTRMHRRSAEALDLANHEGPQHILDEIAAVPNDAKGKPLRADVSVLGVAHGVNSKRGF